MKQVRWSFCVGLIAALIGTGVVSAASVATTFEKTQDRAGDAELTHERAMPAALATGDDLSAGGDLEVALNGSPRTIDSIALRNELVIDQSVVGKSSGDACSLLDFGANSPAGLAFNGDIGLFVLIDDSDDLAYLFDSNCVAQSTFSLGAFGAHNAQGIAYDLVNDIYVVVDSSDIEAYFTNVLGLYQGQCDLAALAASNPRGAAYNPSAGTFAIIDSGTDEVYIIDDTVQDGGTCNLLATFSTAGFSPSPESIAYIGDSNEYAIVDADEDEVFVVNTDFLLQDQFSVLNIGSNVRGMAYLPTEQTYYFVDAGADRLVRLTYLTSGPDPNVDGFLRIAVDEYGSWGGFAGAGLTDEFNPMGTSAGLPVGLSSGFLLFVPSRSQRLLKTTNSLWLEILPPSNLTATITNNTVFSDEIGDDGIYDTAMSSYAVTGAGGTNLAIDLVQTLAAREKGVSELTQTYSIMNNDGSPITLQLVRVFDGDLIFDGDSVNDEVGTTTNGAGGEPFVYMREVGDCAKAVTLSGEADAYFGGKLGIFPRGLPPAYGFGTDVQIYDAFGLPPNWVNHIAGVGSDTDGDSGAQPLGCDDATGCDAFIGLLFDVTIPAGDTEEVSVVHTYGACTRPPNDDCLMLDITGSCPGTITLAATGGKPNSNVGILHSASIGNTILAAGPCAGTQTGLDSPQLFTIVPVDGSGEFTIMRQAPSLACGRFVQLLEPAAGCALSNVTQIP